MKRNRARGSGESASGFFHWLLVAAAAGFLGWILWRHIQFGRETASPNTSTKKNSQPGPPPPIITDINLPKTNRTVARTNKVVEITNSSRLMLPNSSTGGAPVLPLPAISTTNQVKTNQNPLVTNAVSKSFDSVSAKTILDAQVALSRLGYSPGSIDGVAGSQTKVALSRFQQEMGLSQTGRLDERTKARLLLKSPAFTTYAITSEDINRLRSVPSTWLGKSERDRLDYETILELFSERGHAHPSYIKQLNPGIDWDNIKEGARIKIPDAAYPPPKTRASFVKIHLGEKTLDAYDVSTNLLAHFPCSIARKVEKRPVGMLHVVVVVLNPNYVFNPEVFPESQEGQELGRKLVLPPGPNNPVGVAWIGLDKPGYGIHGTPKPEDVGRTESHGCFRLANWNAEYLAQIVSIGTPILIDP